MDCAEQSFAHGIGADELGERRILALHVPDRHETVLAKLATFDERSEIEKLWIGT